MIPTIDGLVDWRKCTSLGLNHLRPYCFWTPFITFEHDEFILMELYVAIIINASGGDLSPIQMDRNDSILKPLLQTTWRVPSTNMA